MVNVAEDRNTPMEPSDEALCRRAADGSREAEGRLSGAIPVLCARARARSFWRAATARI